jgi:hypothetical protein
MRSKLHSVRETVAALRAALLAPSTEALYAQMPALQQAVATLGSLQAESSQTESLQVRSPESAPRQELEAVARELSASGKLIAQGLALTQGMARLLAPVTGGYRQDGEPAPLQPAGTLLVRG